MVDNAILDISNAIDNRKKFVIMTSKQNKNGDSDRTIYAYNMKYNIYHFQKQIRIVSYSNCLLIFDFLKIAFSEEKVHKVLKPFLDLD